MFKKNRCLAVFVMVLTCGGLQAQTLDNAIKNAASDMSNRLPNGSVIAVINFQSQSTRLTDYVIDELNNAIVHIGALSPVERRRLNAVRNELDFNMSGEVSDESAQNIGRMLGAQSIIMGSIEIIGSQYKIRFQVITTETATIQYAFSENIRNDGVLESLLQGTNYLVDFTVPERLGTSALNLFFGAGSFFIEQDKFGGGMTAAIEGLGAVAVITGFILYKAYDIQDRDVYYDYQSGSYVYSSTPIPMLQTYFAYPFFIGLATYGAGAIFGIIRGQIYHKPGSQIARMPFDGLGIDLVSTSSENMGLKISYTWRF